METDTKHGPEAGITPLPNWLIDALIAAKLAATQIQLALLVARLTLGMGRDEVKITLRGLAACLHTGRITVAKTVRRLVAANIITRRYVPGDNEGSTYRLVLDPTKWDVAAKLPDKVLEVLERDDWTCVYCGARDPETMTIDHVIPTSDDGPDETDNMVAACRRCNGAKRALGLDEFIRRLGPGARERLAPLVRRAAATLESIGSADVESAGCRVSRPDPLALGSSLWCPVLEMPCPGPLTSDPDLAASATSTSSGTSSGSGVLPGRVTGGRARFSHPDTNPPQADKVSPRKTLGKGSRRRRPDRTWVERRKGRARNKRKTRKPPW